MAEANLARMQAAQPTHALASRLARRLGQDAEGQDAPPRSSLAYLASP
jgi:hypothetical protein